MLTELRIQNFKSWADTGAMRFAPITGLFGANSSGKTSILQVLLMLKQTAEFTDRSRVLHLGDERSLADLGTFYDVIHQHGVAGGLLGFKLNWQLPENAGLDIPSVTAQSIEFEATFQAISPTATLLPKILVQKFAYHIGEVTFGMERDLQIAIFDMTPYVLKVEGYDRELQNRKSRLPPPVRFYGFPDEVYAHHRGVGFLAKLALALENLFGKIFYLGPLREHPRRSYAWSGESLSDVGQKGERAIQALLASQSWEKLTEFASNSRWSVQKRVAHWLKEMGLIHEFSLEPIAENRKEYEVRVKKTISSSEVLITDVGFGVSQVLPALILCYYIPEGSILILEQPEIHLHPAVQSVLADVFIDAIKTRNIQIILESHSEHLLRRLQRRIAEGALGADQTALYFCEMKDGASHLTTLKLDDFGNIANWPQDFFGDEMGDMTAMLEAEIRRRNGK